MTSADFLRFYQSLPLTFHAIMLSYIAIFILGEIMDSIKTVGNSGQISLGKKYAGQTVILSEIDTGVWIIKTGRFVPDSEKWLHRPDVQSELKEAVDWAEDNPPRETNLDDLGDRIK
jgi:hypothetical protein